MPKKEKQGVVISDKMDKTVTADGMLIVRDHVTWENLIPDQDYRLQGVLMDKGSNKPLSIDGKAVTAQAGFRPKTKDGETYMYFSFDGSVLFADPDDGKTDGRGIEKSDDLQILPLVAFEELYISGQETSKEDPSGNGTDGTDNIPQDADKEGTVPQGKADQAEGNDDEYLVAVHKDLEDPAQTVFVREPQKPVQPEELSYCAARRGADVQYQRTYQRCVLYLGKYIVHRALAGRQAP